MRGGPLCIVVVTTLASSMPAYAQAHPDEAARDELKKGYELKIAGHCEEALPHLQASVRLDPQMKAFANLADCEDSLGKLIDASKHWQQVQQLAASASNTRIEEDAGKHLSKLETRIASLVVRIAVDAPDGTQVTVDDQVVAPNTLVSPILVDPGSHVLVARAAGRDPGTVSIDLAEGQRKEVVVRPAPAAPVAAEPSLRPEERGSPRRVGAEPASAARSPWRTVGLATAGVGVAGLVVGGVFGAIAVSDKGSAECSGTVCPTSTATSKLESAQNAGTISTVLFIAGGVLTGAGAATWFLAPRPVQLAPTVGRNGVGVALIGEW